MSERRCSMAPRITHLIAVLALTTPVNLLAQQEARIAPGDRVRVMAPSISADLLVGTVLEVGADTCLLAIEGHAPPYSLPFTSIRRLDLSRGTRSNTGKGAKIGAVIGAGLGAVLGGLIATEERLVNPSCDPDNNLFGCQTEETTDYAVVAAFAVGLAVVGAGAGALIGAVSKSERWKAVPLGELRVGPSPVTEDGVALSVSLRL